jgi:hypothetical protein
VIDNFSRRILAWRVADRVAAINSVAVLLEAIEGARRKHQWLFLHSLESVATIRRLLAFYVHEHNHVLPHSAIRGQTPDEMYFGTGNAVAADLTTRAIAARRARVAANRSASCKACPSLDAVA